MNIHINFSKVPMYTYMMLESALMGVNGGQDVYFLFFFWQSSRTWCNCNFVFLIQHMGM